MDSSATMYVLVMQGSIPTLKQVKAAGTTRIGDKTYLLVEAQPIHQTPTIQPPVSKPAPTPPAPPTQTHLHMTSPEASVMSLYGTGKYSIEQIGKKVKLSHTTVSKVIREAGLETPADKVRKFVEDALLEAGEEGATPRQLSILASGHTRTGPILTAMLKNGTVKRLENGNWAIR